MTLTLQPKPTLESFIQTCTPLAVIESLEAEMQERVDSIANALLQFEAYANPVENLAHFLKADRNFLGVVLALTNLSQEKFLRILSAERFATQDYQPEWGIERIHTKMRSEDGFAERIAQLFLDGKQSPILAENVAAFYLNQLALPQDWDKIIRDPNIIQNVIRQKLAGEYTDRKGDAIEGIIRQHLDSISQRYGISHQKGQVRLVRKEVDHVIPSIDEPHIMIMASYMETTSSSQTARANEQSEMYSIILSENRRYKAKHIFINFVDGAGWLARRSDLRKLYEGCDFILNLNTLDQLEAIIGYYLPKAYFTRAPKPTVEG